MAARLLIAQRHEVVLHARNDSRAADARAAAPGAADVLVGDLSSMTEVRSVAEQANASGPSTIQKSGRPPLTTSLTLAKSGPSACFE